MMSIIMGWLHLGPIWDWLHSEMGVQVLLALLTISEALDAIPFIKASSVWKAIYNAVKAAASWLGVVKP